MSIEKAKLEIDNGYIAIQMDWSEVRDCTFYYEDIIEMQTILLWALKGDMIIHGYTINYEIEMDKEKDYQQLEDELNRDFDDFLDGFLNEEDEEN